MILSSTKETDTLFYKLSKSASDTLDMLIQEKSVSYIYLVANYENNKYYFSFKLIKCKYKSEKDDYILEHTNRYLKTDKHILKIYNEIDNLFSVSPNNSMDYISHCPTAGITVNGSGDLLEYYSESYKLNEPRWRKYLDKN